MFSARRPRRVVRGLGRAFLYLSIYLRCLVMSCAAFRVLFMRSYCNPELDFAKRPQQSPSRYTCCVASNVSDESTGLDWVPSFYALHPARLAPCLSISRQPSARQPSAGPCGMDHRAFSVVLAAAAASGNVLKGVAVESGALEHVTAARRSHRRGLAAPLERREHEAMRAV